MVLLPQETLESYLESRKQAFPVEGYLISNLTVGSQISASVWLEWITVVCVRISKIALNTRAW